MRGVVRVVAGALFLWLAASMPVRASEPRIPPPRGFVNDFARVLDDATTQRLERLITQLREQTGAEIAVVTVDSTQPLSAFDYAMRIAEQWRPGAKGKDNGVVFLVAVKDRELHILTGYGIEGALPDGRVGEIRDQLIVPAFKRGDYAAGIRAGSEAMAAVIAREYGATLPDAAPAPLRHPPGGAPALLLVLIFLAVMTFLFRSGLWPLLFVGGWRRRYGGFYGGSFGGGGFSGSGGGFGGFGGGGFGGGGAGGKW